MSWLKSKLLIWFGADLNLEVENNKLKAQLAAIHKVAQTEGIPSRKIRVTMDSELQGSKNALLWIQKTTEPFAEIKIVE